MKKIHNFAEIEKLVYEEDGEFEQSLRFSRFIQIDKSQKEDYYCFYDCLCLNIVMLHRDNVRKWKTQQLMEQDFPFCIDTYSRNEDLYKSYKKEWYIAVEKAKDICYFLNKKINKNLLNIQINQDLKNCIENIHSTIKLVEKTFHNNKIKEPQEPPISELLINNKKASSSKNQQDKVVKVLEDSKTNNNTLPHEKSDLDKDFTIVDNFVKTLQSPNLFHELNFGEKHTNKVYLLLEKIFHNFVILSKYKMEHVYEQVAHMDQYLVNHMKNIYLAQNFPMINIDEETVSILTKFNTYLTEEIDKYLEQCIDNQLSLIDSIHNKFTKVNQI